MTLLHTPLCHCPALTFGTPIRQFCEQLRQPLCLALLRNCMSDFAEAYSAAGRLFAAVLLQPRLRLAAKAEMGAFYPLLLLRPLEAERPEPAQQAVALAALAPLAAQAQLLVGIPHLCNVNYMKGLG